MGLMPAAADVDAIVHQNLSERKASGQIEKLAIKGM
jgi:hypothetical protein